MSRRRVTIVGLGLMGGSLAMALRRTGRWRVVGLTRADATARQARRRGAVDQVLTDAAAALAESEVVVYCSPVDKIVPLARTHRQWISPGALVMDIGSVKGPIVRGMEKVLAPRSNGNNSNGPVFVGAHPMAGSEKSGVAHARADLFNGAICALTPTVGTPRSVVQRAEAFWRSIGARPRVISPDVHDQAVALVSHVPHVVADALVLAARGWPGGPSADILRTLAAGSFRDATRVAAADPIQWAQIFQMNRPSLRRALARFQSEMARLQRGGWNAPSLRQAQRDHAKWFSPPKVRSR